MKTQHLFLLSTLAVAAALLVARAGTAATGIAFVASGVLAMLYADYGRTMEPVRARAGVISIGETRRQTPALRTAA